MIAQLKIMQIIKTCNLHSLDIHTFLRHKVSSLLKLSVGMQMKGVLWCKVPSLTFLPTFSVRITDCFVVGLSLCFSSYSVTTLLYRKKGQTIALLIRSPYPSRHHQQLGVVWEEWKYSYTMGYLWVAFMCHYTSIFMSYWNLEYTKDVTLHHGKSGRWYGPRSYIWGDPP